jgi:UDP-N-acetylmuramate--alanine ligase
MYTKTTHIHFIGIGGIGMSGIATILKLQGYEISGCDTDLEQKSITNLHALGCVVYHGNNTLSCHNTTIDVVVYSSAISLDNPEIKAAQQRGIPTIARALMLAELMRTKYSIAIAGAHGKTTTTSLISHILIEAQHDPTVIVGGHLKNISTNARFGRGDFLVAETDESDKSFLRLYPTLAIVTNIDLEHLDTYHDLEDIKNAFRRFLSNIPFYGKAFICSDDPHIKSLLPLTHIKTIKYGTDTEADFYAHSIILDSDHSTFMVTQRGHTQSLGPIQVPMPGTHNVLNALAALAVARDIGIPLEIIIKALKNFKGIERRFSFKGIFQGAEIFDDYGHHPTEIRATILVARKRARGRLIVVFQPHRYTRIHHLWNEFLQVFLTSTIDELIVTDIYPAGEDPIETISSSRFIEELKTRAPCYPVNYVSYDPTFTTLQQTIMPLLKEKDLLLLLGAGNIYKFATTLCSLQ